MTKASQVLDMLAKGVFLVLLAAFVLWFTVPRLLGWHAQVVLSGSMEPTLPLGGVAFMEPAKPDYVEVGDVLTFRHPEKPRVLVTHRVIEITSQGNERIFNTKGDANEDPDNWGIRDSQVVGIVKFAVPYMGYITQRVQTKAGFLFLVGLPAIVLIFGEIQNIRRELRKSREPQSASAVRQAVPPTAQAAPPSALPVSEDVRPQHNPPTQHNPPSGLGLLLIVPALLLTHFVMSSLLGLFKEPS